MKAYPDISFLCALYRLQANSTEAAAYFAAMPGSLEVTTLLLYEFRQAVRFQIRLHRHDPSKGYPRAEGNKMLADLKSDLIGKRIRSITRATLEVDAASGRRHGFVHEKPFVFFGAYRGASRSGSRRECRHGSRNA